MNLSHYLGHTFIVSLAEDSAKRNKLLKKLQSLGVEPEVFITERLSEFGEGLLMTNPRTDSFFISKPGELGCMHSHYTLVKMAKLRGLEKVTIIEDDSLVINDWLGKVKDSFDKLPDDWHFLYLNSCPRFPFTDFEFLGDKKIVRAWCFSCTSGYTIRNTFYDAVIEFFESGVYVADNVYGWLQNENPSDKSVPDYRLGPKYSKKYNIYGLNPSLLAPNVRASSSIRDLNIDHEYDYHIRNNFTIHNYEDYL